MPAFNLEDYEPVEERLKRFWAENPAASIRTEVVHTYNNGGVIIRATLSDGDWLISQGLAEEHPGDKGPNQNCWVENAETSAIGRALANWKYSGDKRPSREEMAKAGRAEGNSPAASTSPSTSPTTPTATSGSSSKKPPNFRGMLFYRAKEAGLNSDKLAQERFGVKTSKELTDEQAKQLLDELKANGQRQMASAVATVQQGFGTSEEPF